MKYLCFYAGDYHNEFNGKTVTRKTIHAINLENRNDEKTSKGFQKIEIDIKKSLVTLEDFPELPGVYNIELGRTAPSGKEKGSVKVAAKANLDKAFSFPNRPDQVLVLGAKWVDGNLDDGTPWKGISIDLVDPNMINQNDENLSSRGIYVLSEAIENFTFNQLKNLPGWYRAEYKTIRNRKKQEQDRITNLIFVEEFKIEQLLPPKPAQQAA